MKKVIIIALLNFIHFGSIFAQLPQQDFSKTAVESSRYWLDIDYVGDGHIGHRLDIHLPREQKEKYPVVICIYGSAWLSNSWKAHTFRDSLGQTLLANGYAVVSINYRSSHDAPFPAQLHDVKAAIRFVRANASVFSLDESFIGVTGWSSGGHLAAFAGVTSGLASFDIEGDIMDLQGDLGIYQDYSSEVDAVVDWFGPTDFLIMDQCGSVMTHDDPESPESLLIGGAIQENPTKCAKADPANYATKDTPPFLILHGDADPLVPHCQSEHLYHEQQEAGVESKLVIVKGGEHGPGVMIDSYYDQMISFFNRIKEK